MDKLMITYRQMAEELDKCERIAIEVREGVKPYARYWQYLDNRNVLRFGGFPPLMKRNNHRAVFIAGIGTIVLGNDITDTNTIPAPCVHINKDFIVGDDYAY